MACGCHSAPLCSLPSSRTKQPLVSLDQPAGQWVLGHLTASWALLQFQLSVIGAKDIARVLCVVRQASAPSNHFIGLDQPAGQWVLEVFGDVGTYCALPQFQLSVKGGKYITRVHNSLTLTYLVTGPAWRLHLEHCLSFNLMHSVFTLPSSNPQLSQIHAGIYQQKREFQCTQQSRICFWPCPVYNAAHTRAVGNGSSRRQCYIGSYHALTKGVNTN